MAVARIYYYLAPPTYLSKVVDPLLRLLPVSPEIERAVLPNLYAIVCDAPVRLQPGISLISYDSLSRLSWTVATFPVTLSAFHHTNY